MLNELFPHYPISRKNILKCGSYGEKCQPFGYFGYHLWLVSLFPLRNHNVQGRGLCAGPVQSGEEPHGAAHAHSQRSHYHDHR